jgi:hypothetical protein
MSNFRPWNISGISNGTLDMLCPALDRAEHPDAEHGPSR